MKRSFIVTVAVLVLSAGIASAEIHIVPPGLSEGDPYRLVFLTSSKMTAQSTDIAVYNAFVDGVAKSTNSFLKSIDTTWTAIASTSSVSAINNTNTPTSTTDIPIYLIDGNKVADNYADLWDGSIDHIINWTELDNSFERSAVWTGTTLTGEIMASHALGDANARYGNSGDLDNCWIASSDTSTSLPEYFYGISGVLVVPEPATLALLSLGGLAMLRRRKR